MTGEITIQVDFYASLKKAFGESSAKVSGRAPLRVGAVLAEIGSKPGRRNYLFDESGAPRPDLAILKNGRNINLIGGLDVELEQGDILAIFPRIAGG